MVPGITAGLGAAAQFEAPLTYRHEALRITFLTAHKAKDAETVDWSVLTWMTIVVVYMGMTAAPSVRAGLLAAGRLPQTPVGIFARVTRPDAQAVVGTLENFPLVEKIDGGPAILIIGDVVAHSAPWRQSTSIKSSPNCWMLPNDLSASTKSRSPVPLDGDRQPHLGRHRDLSHRAATGLVGELSDAAIVRTSDEARALLAEANADDVGAVGAYIAPAVELKDSGEIKPGNLRERIRLEGSPSTCFRPKATGPACTHMTNSIAR